MGRHKGCGRDDPVFQTISITGLAIERDGCLWGVVRGSLHHYHMHVVGISSYFSAKGSRAGLHGDPFFYGDQEDLVKNFNNELPARIRLLDKKRDEAPAKDRAKQGYEPDKVASGKFATDVKYTDKFSGESVTAVRAFYMIPCDELLARPRHVQTLVREMESHLDDVVRDSTCTNAPFSPNLFSNYPCEFEVAAAKAPVLYAHGPPLVFTTQRDDFAMENVSIGTLPRGLVDRSRSRKAAGLYDGDRRSPRP